MRLEKKKMATLLAAILIAMMGVMPALAPEYEGSGPVTLSATVEMAMLYITVPTDPVVFSNVFRDQPATASFVITTRGEAGYTVDLTASLTDEAPAFFDPLTLNTFTVGINYAENILLDVSHTMDLSFIVPVDALGGYHSGTLTIFAQYGPLA